MARDERTLLMLDHQVKRPDKCLDIDASVGHCFPVLIRLNLSLSFGCCGGGVVVVLWAGTVCGCFGNLLGFSFFFVLQQQRDELRVFRFVPSVVLALVAVRCVAFTMNSSLGDAVTVLILVVKLRDKG